MAFYLLAINKNEAAICITQVAAFHFLTNYLSTIQKIFSMILFVEGVSLFQIVAAEDGLKAQKLLAQGIALGIVKVSKAPCKGKSLINCQVSESFCPFRATGLHP